MNTGSPTHHQNTLTVTQAGAIVIFTEESRTLLYTHTLRKAAQAQGIDAMMARAIDTGDYDLHADMIQHAASELAEALKHMADVIAQMKIQPTA
ncbi:hypothetical protein V0R55_24710 [Pseudomonas soli]|uniref:DUF3077 domain-containing protein n=1 Tax=Pseudomonas soli TaxID=1306993 RepID=A0ABU7GWC6_9PSED|nr:hypothetical protein [Pseudomonas soli]MEE1883370.1 hypothetical protein [Pseudomonas soli]